MEGMTHLIKKIIGGLCHFLNLAMDLEERLL
jgi:hypothetical protein